MHGLGELIGYPGGADGIDPFVTLSFLALPVLPELRLTDLGLFDVTAFRLVD